MLLSACAAQHGNCEHRPCPSGQYCDTQYRICILGSEQVVQITSPDGGATDAGVVVLKGTVNPRAAVTASYRTPDGGWTPLVLDAEGAFETSVMLPPLNRALFAIEVHASSSVQAYSGEAEAVVDNVPPTVGLSIPDGSDRAPDTLAVVFSEAVTPVATGWFQLTGSAANSDWSSDRTRYVVSGFLPNKTMRGRVLERSLQDGFGNLNQGEVVSTFFTPPAVPPPGRVFLADLPNDQATFRDLSVASDEDGVATLALVLNTALTTTSVSIHRLDPTHGSASFDFVGVGDGASNAFFQPFAWVDLDTTPPLPTKRRLSGMHVRAGAADVASTGNTVWLQGGGLPTNLMASDVVAIAPVLGGCGDIGLWSVAQLRLSAGQTLYQTSSTNQRPLAMRAQFFAPRSPSSWQVLSQNASLLSVAEFRATCDTPVSAQFQGPVTLRGDLSRSNAHLSTALSQEGRSLYVFDAVGGSRAEACYGCVVDAVGRACEAETTRAAEGENLRVASAYSGNWVIGARRNASSKLLELVQRDLSNCAGAWELLATVPASDSATSFDTAMVGVHPGLFYLVGGKPYVFWH